MNKIIKKTNLILMILLVFLIFINGCGDKKKKKDNNPIIKVPNPPANVLVTEADSRLSVSWEKVENATFYNIYIAENEDKSFAELASVTTDQSCVISGLTNDTTYYLWVKSKNSAGTSDFSNTIQGTPKKDLEIPYPPISFNLTPASESITVGWEAVPGATSYEVWYGTSNNTNEAQMFKDVIDALICEITGLKENTQYYVWLKAKNSVGISDFSFFQYTTTQATGSITGLVNSDGSFTITLPETNETQYFNNSAYFTFNNLPVGSYHIKIERSGYKGIIEKISLGKNENKNIGQKTINTKLSTGKGLREEILELNQTYPVSDSVTKIFSFPRTRNAKVYYNILFMGLMAKYTDGTASKPFIFQGNGSSFFSYDFVANTSYVMNIKGGHMDDYFKIVYSVDATSPKIDISETWCNVDNNKQVAIDVLDNDTDVKSVRYAITNSLNKPSSFATIPSHTAIQFSNKGIWYLHIEADDNEIPTNTSYRVEGPYIIN